MNRKQSSAFDYITIKTIGQGSFGKVFLVKNRHETIKTLHNASKNSSISCDHPCHGKNEKFSLLHRKQNSSHLFVMKQIPIGHLSKKEQESSVKEAIILSKMNHRNICKYIDSFITERKSDCICDDSQLYIVMEYADGGDLQQEIKKRTQTGKKYFEENQIISIFLQCCYGLNHVHERNILHRDLKSQNIFLTKRGILKIGDFGIAKVLDSSLDKAQTQVGTPYYFSPEICEGTCYTNTSDVWSLGCVFYEIAQLELPFQARNIATLIRRILLTKPKPLDKTKYCQWLCDSIEGMLEKDPTKRPSMASIVQSDRFQRYSNDILPSKHYSSKTNIIPSSKSQMDDMGKTNEFNNVKECKKIVKGEKGNNPNFMNFVNDNVEYQNKSQATNDNVDEKTKKLVSIDLVKNDLKDIISSTDHEYSENSGCRIILNPSCSPQNVPSKKKNAWEKRRDATTNAMIKKNRILYQKQNNGFYPNKTNTKNDWESCRKQAALNCISEMTKNSWEENMLTDEQIPHRSNSVKWDISQNVENHQSPIDRLKICDTKENDIPEKAILSNGIDAQTINKKISMPFNSCIFEKEDINLNNPEKHCLHTNTKQKDEDSQRQIINSLQTHSIEKKMEDICHVHKKKFLERRNLTGVNEPKTPEYSNVSHKSRSSVDSAHKQKTETSINNGHRVEKTKKLSKVLDALHQMNKQLLRMDCAQHNH